MRRIYTLALSDPSIIEAMAILIGLISSFVGFFYLFVRLAYQASLSASPINPSGSIPGYVSGFNQPIPIPSLDSIRVTAARTFLNYLFASKLEFWLIFMISLFLTIYPITTRLKNTMIPAMSIIGCSLDSIVWAYFVPVVFVSLGYIFLFIVMSMSVYMFYFNMNFDELFLSTVASISLFMLLVTVIFYDAFITTGKTYFGAVLGFLLSLCIDKINPTAYNLVLLCIGLTILGLVSLAISIWRRWISI